MLLFCQLIKKRKFVELSIEESRDTSEINLELGSDDIEIDLGDSNSKPSRHRLKRKKTSEDKDDVTLYDECSGKTSRNEKSSHPQKHKGIKLYFGKAPLHKIQIEDNVEDAPVTEKASKAGRSSDKVIRFVTLNFLRSSVFAPLHCLY